MILWEAAGKNWASAKRRENNNEERNARQTNKRKKCTTNLWSVDPIKGTTTYLIFIIF
jgi:3'-phosphoadenosine 5'-phosphosulfate (PAPS) 3'-phosphatase